MRIRLLLKQVPIKLRYVSMEKVFNPREVEVKIYEKWEKSGAFTPEVPTEKLDNRKTKPPFVIIMPPPNANEDLHIGHVRFVTIEDVLIRYHRMCGEPTLWLPGADHAGIETQYVFEKKLKQEGKSRFDFDRETLYQMIWDYSIANKERMEAQLRALGASCDWTRNKFTLDPEIIKIVYRTFKKLYADKFIYRGEKVVNYCTFCGTSYSDLEVEKVERGDPLYYVRYPKKGGGYVVVATTRPETIYVDTYLAVNPKDKKYKDLRKVKILNPLANQVMQVVEDNFVDPAFGTGIVKITPAHDFNDELVGIKYGIPSLQIIGADGRIMDGAGPYAGMRVKEAREKVVDDLKEKGLIEKVDENYKHVIGLCYRCKNVIEPLPLEQWFIKIEHLSALARKAIKDGRVKFAAKRFEKIANHWLTNLRDWNISRQIVWGIRIPAWRCGKCGEWAVTAGGAPEKCDSCLSTNLVQDEDTFDTWFSSSQWPFATLQTTKPGDFEYFYPTSVMETAYDIIPFWVIRMIMLGLYETGKVPFEHVLIHGLVRDKQGQKISKSKDNVIDPLIMVERYGADALRMGILWGALVENDISLSEDNVRGQRNFANKIWNIARFVLMDQTKATKENEDDRWIKKELKATTKKVTAALDKYRLNEAVEELYEFVWHKYADIYLEKTKPRRAQAQETLEFILKESLKLIHPFMPYVTEAVWSELGEKEPLITSPWPQ